jgi:hypothetical protein
VHNVLGGSGHPLDAASRAFFEPRFGRDFSRVRIHTGLQAAESTRAIHARAYTRGSDIVFDQGEYQPSSQAGRHLLAHELTHVLHQSAAPSSTLYRDADTTPPTLEEEAKDLIARYILRMIQHDDFSGIAHELDFALLALRYDFLLKVFEKLDSIEDNVGAELISITPPSRLSLYAASAPGRRMLNVLYDAIITGDVTDFERKQADKILECHQDLSGQLYLPGGARPHCLCRPQSGLHPRLLRHLQRGARAQRQGQGLVHIRAHLAVLHVQGGHRHLP